MITCPRCTETYDPTRLAALECPCCGEPMPSTLVNTQPQKVTKMDDLSFKEQKVLAEVDGVTVYTEVHLSSRDTLPNGLYRMQQVMYLGGIVNGFRPMLLSNDRPLGIDGKVDVIVREIDTFLGRRDIYKKFGFAHKRGYLLYGPPGCGKSSTLRLLEERFIERFDGVVLFWSPGQNPRGWYEQIRAREPSRRVMLVVEDLDSQMHYFEEDILEFLDGQVGLDNFVLVATTNNLDAIPSRIKDRPSRVDRLLEIGLPTEETRFLYLKSIGVDAPMAKSLAKKTKGLAIAALKEVVIATICLGDDLGPVLERLKKADLTPLDKGDESEQSD